MAAVRKVRGVIRGFLEGVWSVEAGASEGRCEPGLRAVAS